jgi:Domain of unknown function (DUF4124)
MLRLASSWIVSMALLATPALAQVYKWVDEHGMVNYGDKPPLRSKAAHALDEGAGSLSVVPGIPKDELDRLRRQDDRQRLQRLEREVEELRAQAHAGGDDVPQTVYIESYVPAYGYPGYGHWPQRSRGVRKPGLRPQHPIVEPRPDVGPRRGSGRRP